MKCKPNPISNTTNSTDEPLPEAILSPAVAAGAEVELVAARLGIVVPVSDAAVAAQRPELHVGAAAGPLSEGEVRAAFAGTEVAHDQDALKPDESRIHTG